MRKNNDYNDYSSLSHYAYDEDYKDDMASDEDFLDDFEDDEESDGYDEEFDDDTLDEEDIDDYDEPFDDQEEEDGYDNRRRHFDDEIYNLEDDIEEDSDPADMDDNGIDY